MTAPRLTLALLGAVLALLLAETLARLHGDRLCLETPGVVYQRDARFGWGHVPDISGWVGTCRTPRVPMAPVDVDSHGLIGPERAREKPANTARILLLGGNGPEGLGVPPAETMAPLLEGLADRRRGVPLEVLNAAVGGFVLDNDLLYFRTEGRQYAPDVVLVVLDPTSELVALSPRLIYVSGNTAPAKPTFRFSNDRLELTPLDASPEAEAVAEPAGVSRLQLFRLWQGLPRRIGPAITYTQGEVTPAGTVVDLPAEQARARALAKALLTALRDEVQAAGARLVVAIGPIRAAAWDEKGGQDDEVLRRLTRELDVPTFDLGLPFRASELDGRRMYLPGSGRWGPDGHFVASQALFHFMAGRQLLPAGVVPVIALNGGRRVEPGDLGRAIPEFLWRERTSLGVRFVLFGVIGVAVVWMGAVLPAAARQWLRVAVGMALVAALGAPLMAPVVLVVGVAWWVALEQVPRRLSLPAVLLLAAGIVIVPLVRSLPQVAGSGRDARLFFALASGVLLLRLFGYAIERRRSAAPLASLAEFLEATFFFPTLLFGPVESVERHRAASVADATAPASFAALGRHLGASTIGAGRLLLGAAELTIATGVLNLVSPDVWLTAGRGVDRMRLWLWLGELPLTLYLLGSGVSDVAIGLGAMAGVRVGENFRAPWAARDAADFWRRWLTSIGAWLKRSVYEPVRARQGATVAVVTTFVVSLLWLVWLAGAFFQAGGTPQVPVGLLAWCAMNAAAVMAVRWWPGRVVAVLGLVVVFLSWMPFSLPPGLGLGTCASILLRLVGIR